MKKILFIFFTALLMVFVACEKEPDDNQSSSSSENQNYAALVVGTWAIDCKASTQHEVYTSPIDNWDEYYTMEESGLLSGKFVFKADGTGTLTTVYIDDEFTDPINYSVKNDTLSLGDDENYKIEKLDKQELILFGEGSFSDEIGTYSYSVHYVLHRMEENDID